MNSSSSSIAKEPVLARLSKKLHDELAITEEAARWAVESWALALGVITTAELGKFAPQQAAPIEKAPSNQPVTAYGLQPFSLYRSNPSPEIRGFRLGMSLQQVLNLFNGLRLMPANEIGLQSIRINVDRTSTNIKNSYYQAYTSTRVSPSIEGLKSLKFQFLDESLCSIGLEYDGTVKWSSLGEFAQKVYEILGVPASNVPTRGEQQITPQTFRIYVDMGIWGQKLHLTDLQAELTIKERTAAKLKERKATKEDHQRRNFSL